LLIQKGADVIAQDDEGSTPLHKAAEQGQENTIKLLVHEFGAPVNIHNFRGRTPNDVAKSTSLTLLGTLEVSLRE
jgi:ankyrin repeat protein